MKPIDSFHQKVETINETSCLSVGLKENIRKNKRMFIFILLTEAHFHLQGHSFFNNPFQLRDTKANDTSLFKYDDVPLPNTLTNSFSTNGSSANEIYSNNNERLFSNGNTNDKFFSNNNNDALNRPNNTLGDPFLNSLDSQSSTEPQDMPQKSQPRPLYHLRPSIIIRRIPIYFSSLDENSLDEESTPENNPEGKKSTEPKTSFFKRVKEAFCSFFQSITVFRFLSFALFAVIFTLVGYQMRKREERSNYVRLPNEG